MNNFKLIREVYGATQEEIASAINVNRVTVANWEIGSSKASSGNQEKLSIYYGIGPEYFYEKELDNVAKQVVIDTAAKAREIENRANGERKKKDEFHEMFTTLTFPEAMKRYMFSMKMLLATADSGDLEKLKTAALINKKMGTRLEAIIELREQENNSDEPSLFDLMEEIGDKQ